jgi:hypothetical protein
MLLVVFAGDAWAAVLHLASYAVILVGAVLIGAFAVGALFAHGIRRACADPRPLPVLNYPDPDPA